MVTMPTVLVTGGQGFVGQHLVKALLDRGYSVIEYNREGGEVSPRALSQHQVIRAELSDWARLTQVLSSVDVDAIIHTAGQSHPAVSLQAPLGTVAANIDGTMTILEAARLARVRRVVLMSSECAYGVCPESVVDESHGLTPTTPYGVTKAAMDLMASVYTARFTMDVISLRISQVYGPGQRLPEDVHDMLRSAIDERPYRLASGRDQKVQLVHVHDVVQGLIKATQVGAHRSIVYNITGGEQVTLGQLASMVRTLVPTAVIDMGAGLLDYDQQGLFSLKRAQEELGYSPRVPLVEGLASYYQWLTEHEF
jgi:UDP-glucose 4-epimerase